jgi:hypothetical protein
LFARFVPNYGKNETYQSLVPAVRNGHRGFGGGFPATFFSMPLWPLALPAAIIAFRRLRHFHPSKPRRGFTPILETHA